MKNNAHLVNCLWLSLTFFSLANAQTPVFINELHYDNDGADTGEAVEIAGPAGTDISNWSIALYNGSATQLSVYATINLSGVISDQCNGFGALSFVQSGIQNGSPDGLALINDLGTVIQFLSYEGSFTAASGPASGMASVDIGVAETSSTPAGQSLQLIGTGEFAEDFIWAAAANSNFGECNSGQTFVAAEPQQPLLLLTEVVVTPTAGEFIEIFNPGLQPVDLSEVYLTDATFTGAPSTFYYNIVTGVNAGGGGFGDFHARFPDGASIAAGEYQTVALAGSDSFFAEYGVEPTYELFEDGVIADAIADMREAFNASINGQGGLTNSGEFAVIYRWDGESDLVTDLDYVVWGDQVEAVDKTGVALDGLDPDTNATDYLDDTAISDQQVIATSAHANGQSFQRDDLSEGTEVLSGGNGAQGHDETSEDLNNTWCDDQTPTPNAAGTCSPVVIDGMLVFNEISADPDDNNGDANGDSLIDSSGDEFVELINTSGADLDISGWTLSDGTSVRHTFAANTIIADQCGIVVFGGGMPTGDFGDMLVETGSTGTLDLDDAGETLSLIDAADQLVASVTYSDIAANNQSITRNPDITGEFIEHSSVTGASGALFSPGTRADGSNFPGCVAQVAFSCGNEATFIHALQGNGFASPIANGTVVDIEGIVIGDFQDQDGAETELNGYFVQEEDVEADADPLTSEGIFVFDNATGPDVMVGDRVRVRGTITEFNDLTELNNISATAICSVGNPLPVPVALELPVSGDIDLERLEGMLIQLPQTLTVSDQFDVIQFGEFVLSNGRLIQPTNQVLPGSAANAQQLLNDLNQINVDDGRNGSNRRPFVQGRDDTSPLAAANPVRNGYTVTGLQGVLNFSFTDYKIEPTAPYSFDETANPRTAVPELEDSPLRVASFNVLNFFTTIDEGGAQCGPSGSQQNCRGADSQMELLRQTDKLAIAISALDADIIGLVELENNETASLQTLVDALNAIDGQGTWAFIDTGFVGDDVIKAGLLYRPAVVAPVGEVAVLDSSFGNGGFDSSLNRAAPAQTFDELASGERFTVNVHHYKSKGCGGSSGLDSDQGDGQACFNQTRTRASETLLQWLSTDPTGSGDSDFLVLGDLNSYAMEDPIRTLQEGGYVDLVGSIDGTDAYSFVFFGQAGALDYALTSETLTTQVIDATSWHISADEIRAFDYNLETLPGGGDNTRPADFFVADQYRASDHDAIVVSLNLGDGIPDAGAGETFLRLSREFALADGLDAVTVELQVATDSAATLAGIPVSLEVTGNASLMEAAGVTDSKGRFITTLTDMTIEEVMVSARFDRNGDDVPDTLIRNTQPDRVSFEDPEMFIFGDGFE